MTTLVEVFHELAVYKVIDAATATVQNYNAECMSSRPVPVSDTETVSDWRGLYTQFQLTHVLGTIPYRWERDGTTEAALVKVTIQSSIRIAVLDGTLWHNGNVSGQRKADLAKQLLDVPPHEPLVELLGKSNTALLVRETAEEPELIFSHDLFAALNITEDCVALFRRHDSRPVTNGWRRSEEHDWKPWNDEAQECLLEIPDLKFDDFLDGRQS